MGSGFAGFPQEAISFFRGLRKNNKREWFQPRKPVFDEKVKAPMVELVNALNAEMMKFAPDYVTDPQAAIYRLYRDTRFSADKTPYKDHIAASFIRRGTEKHAAAGFYFSVSDKNSEVAGGVYLPGKEQLLAIRTFLLENHEEFRELLAQKKLQELLGGIQGQRLTRPPKGFPAGHAAEDLIRYKQWYVYAYLDSGVVTTPKLLPELVERFRLMTPLIDFLNRPLTGRKARQKRDLLA